MSNVCIDTTESNYYETLTAHDLAQITKMSVSWSEHLLATFRKMKKRKHLFRNDLKEILLMCCN